MNRMKKNTLLRTNILVCTIIFIGFIITCLISYQANFGIFKKDVEHVSTLASDGIYYQLESMTSQPVSVSLTMANDSLLKSFLADEKEQMKSPSYIAELQSYLDAYRLKYNYDSVFLVSAATNRYYHFKGLDRILSREDPENIWYYDFLYNDKEYFLNIDNDQASNNSITIFVNCKIKDADGSIMGVVGVGMKVDYLQELFKTYDDKYNVNATLVDNKGVTQVSSVQTGYEGDDFFRDSPLESQREQILSINEDRYSSWYDSSENDGYMVSRYVDTLQWHLIVENNTNLAKRQYYAQLLQSILVIVLIIFLVLFTITRVIQKYNAQILQFTMASEMEYQRLLQKATEGLYYNIFEFDATNNAVCGEETQKYFYGQGYTEKLTYDSALQFLADSQIKEEYTDAFLRTFSRDHVLESFQSGINSLSFDFIASGAETEGRWFRVTARMFLWSSDQSIRLISYAKDIDEEKRREIQLIEQSQRDSLTGLYNKRTTEDLIAKALEKLSLSECSGGEQPALLIFDIDNFKNVNDSMGHGFGDTVIVEFADELNTQFHDEDIVGRIGGDEFAVLTMHFTSQEALGAKLSRFCSRLARKDFGNDNCCAVACSVGAALYPLHGSTYAELYERADQALYYAKGHGKATYSIYGQADPSFAAVHVDQQEIKLLIDGATDGIVKAVYTPSGFRLLYYNAKCAQLFGTNSEFSAPKEYNMLDHIHPNEQGAVMASFQKAIATRGDFALFFRLLRDDGRYIPVKLKGLFTKELYENQYPIFYAVYTLLSEDPLEIK